MKRFILMAIWLYAGLLAAQAQKKQTVFLELGGASTTFGVHYDTRFHQNTNWGMRVGLAYGNSGNDSFLPQGTNLGRALTIPVDLNYLLGKKKHFLELGMGLSNGIYFEKRGVATRYHTPKVDWGYFVYFDVGYRFQPAEGLLLRAGLNPGLRVEDGQNSVERDAVIYPYLSIGYCF